MTTLFPGPITPPDTNGTEELSRLLNCRVGNLSRFDIALTNLWCATGLPGAEDLDIPQCLATLDALAAQCGQQIQRHLYRLHTQPHEVYNTQAKLSMAWLVQTLKKDYGATYNPERLRERQLGLPGDLSDSRDLFIHGLLGPKRTGTCNSIPVLVTAVARRLGFPVQLTANHYHVLARWEDPATGERFNIEASNPGGMEIPSDEHYRHFPFAMQPWQAEPGYYLKSFTRADEVAMFLFSRVLCMEDNDRLDEALPFLARMVMLAPEEPFYPRYGLRMANQALLARYRRQHPDRSLAEMPEGCLDLPFDPRLVLRLEERPMYLTIAAHFDELQGRFEPARHLLQTAVQESGHDARCVDDLNRFIGKHKA